MTRHVLCAAALPLAVALVTTSARAHPQWNIGIVTGVCGTGTHSDYWQDTCWFNGLRTDVLFLRERNADFGVGPFLDFTTAGLKDGRLGGGGSLLIPINPFIPIVLSAGGYARHSDLGWEPGISGWLFAGSRSYNFDSTYGIATGLMVGLQYGLGDSRETAIVIGLELDGELTILPWILLYDWLRGPPKDE